MSIFIYIMFCSLVIICEGYYECHGMFSSDIFSLYNLKDFIIHLLVILYSNSFIFYFYFLIVVYLRFCFFLFFFLIFFLFVVNFVIH